jgi:6-phosphogluconolactonase
LPGQHSLAGLFTCHRFRDRCCGCAQWFGCFLLFSSIQRNPPGDYRSAPTLGAANCWNAVTPDGRFAYFSNAGSSTISGFAIAANGILTALPGTVVGENPAGATNLDIAVGGDGKFLCTLNGKVGTVGIFSIQNDGTLVPVGSAGGITPNSGFNGIAAE